MLSVGRVTYQESSTGRIFGMGFGGLLSFGGGKMEGCVERMKHKSIW